MIVLRTFSSYTAFSVADSVGVIDNSKLAEKSFTDVDAAFIAAVKAQLQAKGYTLVAKDADPDLGININRIYNAYSGIVSYPDYWGGYPASGIPGTGVILATVMDGRDSMEYTPLKKAPFPSMRWT